MQKCVTLTVAATDVSRPVGAQNYIRIWRGRPRDLIWPTLRQQVLMDASADSFIFVWQRRLIDCRGANGVLPPTGLHHEYEWEAA
jgi:hypothetical protein